MTPSPPPAVKWIEEDSHFLFRCLGLVVIANVSLLAIGNGMPRFRSSQMPTISSAAVRLFECHRISNAERIGTKAADDIRYRLLTPISVEPKRRYPLIVFLHGSGERGSDGIRQLAYLPERMAQASWRKRYRCFVLAPQCPLGDSWTTHSAGSGDRLGIVHQIIRSLLESYPIDEQRIYLTGLSMGGFGSWELAMRYPDLFAAVVPICGGGSPSNAHLLANVAIWAIHGQRDKIVPAETSRLMIQAIRAAGGNPRYTELEETGHNCWSYAYSEQSGVLSWMFSQVRKSAAPPSARQCRREPPVVQRLTVIEQEGRRSLTECCVKCGFVRRCFVAAQGRFVLGT